MQRRCRGYFALREMWRVLCVKGNVEGTLRWGQCGGYFALGAKWRVLCVRVTQCVLCGKSDRDCNLFTNISTLRLFYKHFAPSYIVIFNWLINAQNYNFIALINFLLEGCVD